LSEEGGKCQGWRKKANDGDGTHVLSNAEGAKIRRVKESERARGTHELERVEGGISQDSKRKTSEWGHSLSTERRQRVSQDRKWK
jgi:hypothetical protein